MTEKLSIKQVAEVVEMEGLGYAVTDYLGSGSIEDESLAKAWKEAKTALRKIETIIEPYIP